MAQCIDANCETAHIEQIAELGAMTTFANYSNSSKKCEAVCTPPQNETSVGFSLPEDQPYCVPEINIRAVIGLYALLVRRSVAVASLLPCHIMRRATSCAHNPSKGNQSDFLNATPVCLCAWALPTGVSPDCVRPEARRVRFRMQRPFDSTGHCGAEATAVDIIAGLEDNAAADVTLKQASLLEGPANAWRDDPHCTATNATSCDPMPEPEGLCGQWDLFRGEKSTTMVVPASGNASVDEPASYEWIVFETGAGTKRQQGAALGLSFQVKYKHLKRVRVECDLNELNLGAADPRLYRHVFTEVGCDDAIFEGSLQFTNEAGGVFSSPMVSWARQPTMLPCRAHLYSSLSFSCCLLCVAWR